MINDELRCPRCGDVFHDADMAAHPDRFWECSMCHVVQHKACRGPLPDEHEAERVKALEAATEAMLAASVVYELAGAGPAALLDEAMKAGVRALVRLGELYYRVGGQKNGD